MCQLPIRRFVLSPALVLSILLALEFPQPQQSWRTGALAIDAETGEVILDTRSDQAFRPASTVKLVTSLLAMRTLGPDYVFRTPVLVDTSSACICLAGSGAPLLELDDIERSAMETALSIDPSVPWRLIYDTGCFEDDSHCLGWDEDDWGRAYCPPVEALSFGGNLLEIVVSTVGGPLRVSGWPDLPGAELRPAAGIGADDLTVSVSGWDESPDRVTVQGSLPARSVRTLWTPFPDPSLEFALLFADALGEYGIRVASISEGQAPGGPGIRSISVISSRPLWQITAEMDKWSLNGVAELLLRASALQAFGPPASTAAGCEMAGAMISDLTPSPGDILLADGSGLSRLNRLTPRALAAVLLEGVGSFGYGPEYLASLAVNGQEGTLSTRLTDLPEGAFRGKTGSLNDTSSIAGIVSTASGRRIAVVLMAEVPQGSVYAARNWQDAVIREIYNSL